MSQIRYKVDYSGLPESERDAVIKKLNQMADPQMIPGEDAYFVYLEESIKIEDLMLPKQCRISGC